MQLNKQKAAFALNTAGTQTHTETAEK